MGVTGYMLQTLLTVRVFEKPHIEGSHPEQLLDGLDTKSNISSKACSLQPVCVIITDRNSDSEKLL